MSIKKTFGIILFVSALASVSGVALAASATTSSSAVKRPVPVTVRYTPPQQACIKTAQAERAVVLKAASNVLGTSTVDALKVKQAAIKKAATVLSAATKDLQKSKQAALAAAQKITDAKIRADRIKLANDAYSENPTVKNALAAYTAAVKAANNAYNINPTVKQAQAAYSVTVKAANDQFQNNQKACLPATAVASKGGFFDGIGNAISNFFKKIGSIF